MANTVIDTRRIRIKAVAMAMVCLFSLNTLSYAYSDNNPAPKDVLRPQSIFQPLRDEGIRDTSKMVFEVLSGIKLLHAGKTFSAVNGILTEIYKNAGDKRKIEFLPGVQKIDDKTAARFKIIGREDVVFEIVFQGDDSIAITKKPAGLAETDRSVAPPENLQTAPRNHYKLLLLDLDDTLMDSTGIGLADKKLEKFFEFYSKRIGVSPEKARKIFFKKKAELGTPSNGVTARYLGINLKDVEKYWNEIDVKQYIKQIDPELVQKLIQELKMAKDKGYKIALLSNGLKQMVTNIVRELGIKPFLDHIYAAYDLNMEKPDLEVFKFVIKDTGVDPSEIISIGDSEKKDIIPARKCGMETIHIKEQSQIYELGKAVEALEEKKRASIKAREEKALSEEHYLEASLLRASHEELRGYPVNMHIDLTTIPRNGLTEAQQMEQLGQNMDTIARIIAWHHTFGFDIRYALEHDTDSVYRDRALSILKDSLMKLGSIPGINVDELLLHISQPHAGDRVVEVALKNLEAIKTMQAIPDKTYCVAIKDNVEKTGVAIPNYTAAANMGLSLAALRVAKEKEKRGYNELRDKILRTFRDIYKKCGIINEENGFTADELDLMVAGSSDTRLYYTILYALPPIMRAAVEELKKYHESLHLLLQAA